MLLRPTSFLVAFVMAAMLVSPVLAIDLPDSSQIDSNSYQGQAIRVTTQAVSGVTKSSATLNGFLESLGPYVEVNVWFEYLLNDGTSIVPIITAPTKMTAPGPFSVSVTGLAIYTPYQFRAVASSPLLGGQKIEGAYLPFHTLVDKTPATIAVSNGWASEVSPGAALLHGYLSSLGPYNEVKVWFEWGTSAGFGNKAGEQILYTPGPFSIKISGLSPNIRYYFRSGAFPTVAGGTIVYSTTDSLTTLGAGNLAVGTWPVTNITTTSATITGYLESLGPYKSANVWFEWGKTAAYGHETPMQTVNQTGIYTFSLEGLTAGSIYHFRAKAIPASGGWVTVQSADNQFTTTSLPGIAVSTEPAGGVTANSAVLSGFLTSFGSSSPVSVWFEYGTDTTFGSKTPPQTLNTTGNFRFAVTGLLPATTYYFRSAAFSNGNSAHGQYSSFRTASALALSISTDVASKVGPSSATLYAYINSLGSAPDIQVWFNFGQSPEYGISTPVQTFTSAGTVSAPVSGLTADTTYYFQAVAQAPDGNKAYGSQATFSTVSMPKTAVTTYPATGVTNSSAMLNGYLDNLGNTTSVQAWFEYGTTAEFGNATIVKTFDSPAPLSSTIPALPGTTYYYRAVALNPVTGGSSVSGATISFVTASLPSPPVASLVTSPYDWFIYCQRIVGFEVERILKSLNIYPDK